MGRIPLVALLLPLAACTGAPRRPGSAPVDSASAVRSATAKLDQGETIVKEFRRDSAGYLITLWLKPPPHRAIAGGGGVVRVDRRGRATVVARYQ